MWGPCRGCGGKWDQGCGRSKPRGQGLEMGRDRVGLAMGLRDRGWSRSQGMGYGSESVLDWMYNPARKFFLPIVQKPFVFLSLVTLIPACAKKNKNKKTTRAGKRSETSQQKMLEKPVQTI